MHLLTFKNRLHIEKYNSVKFTLILVLPWSFLLKNLMLTFYNRLMWGEACARKCLKKRLHKVISNAFWKQIHSDNLDIKQFRLRSCCSKSFLFQTSILRYFLHIFESNAYFCCTYATRSKVFLWNLKLGQDFNCVLLLLSVNFPPSR